MFSLPNHFLPLRHGCFRLYSSQTLNLKGFYDVVISGGGLVGTAAAVAIASNPALKNVSVLVIEPQAPKLWKEVPERYSNRVYSVTPGTRKFFEDIACWPKVQALRIKPVRQLQVWETSSDASIKFSPEELDDDVSYIVEEPVLSTALWSRLRELNSSVDVLHGARADKYDIPCRRTKLASESSVDSIEAESDSLVKIFLSNGTEIQTTLLIGADGNNSTVRKAMGVQNLTWKYDQKGIVATVYLSEAQDNSTGWQRFTSTGPVALLPLDEKRSSLVWSTSSEEADRLLRLEDEEFLDALNRAIWDEQEKNFFTNSAIRTMNSLLFSVGIGENRMDQLPPTLTSIDSGSRAAFPLSLGHATQYVIPNVALIGDAAHRIHPLAGLGVNLGFGDVVDLIKNLNDAVSCGYDVNNLPHLLRYESDAQRRVLPIMAAVDGLHRLYTNNWNPIVTLRGLGLQLVNSCSPLKKRIITLASR